MIGNKFKTMIKHSKTLDAIGRLLLYPYFCKQYRMSSEEEEKRAGGYVDKRFLWLKDIHETHIADKCFVVATGPSLTNQDLDSIKNYYSISMNSIILALPNTQWRPDIYMIQDDYVFEKLREDINSAKSSLGFMCISENLARKYGNKEGYNVFPLHYLDHKFFHLKGYGEFKFSTDCYNTIYDGYTITFSALQLAVYMGFREIYLLGCDCNYNQPKAHFVEYGHKDPKSAIMGDKMIQGHFEFKKFADSLGVNVINCTRGGMLEVYPRKKLEDILGGLK